MIAAVFLQSVGLVPVVAVFAAVAVVVAVFTGMAVRELWELGRRPSRRPVRGGRHVWHPPTPREATGPGMPIPLGELPPLPLGPWPPHLVHDGGTVLLDPVTAEMETEWAWRYPVGGWPLHRELTRGQT